MFFWFFPAQVHRHTNDWVVIRSTVWSYIIVLFVPQSGQMDAPLLLWLQGGPGGSSLFGLFNENGPLYVDKDGQGEWMWEAAVSIHLLELMEPLSPSLSSPPFLSPPLLLPSLFSLSDPSGFQCIVETSLGTLTSTCCTLTTQWVALAGFFFFFCWWSPGTYGTFVTIDPWDVYLWFVFRTPSIARAVPQGLY